MQRLDQLAELFRATVHLLDHEDGQVRSGFHHVAETSAHHGKEREVGQSLHIRR